MTDLARLQIRVESLEAEVAERRLNDLQESGQRAERATDGLTKSFSRLLGPIVSVSAALAAVNKVKEVSREFDILNAGLITATGSTEKAAVAFDVLDQFATETPYSLQQVTEGFTKLVNYGLTPSEKALTSYGNTSAALGKDLSQMIEAVADAATGEFERLKEFGIKSRQEGDNVSFTFRGVTTTVKKNAEEIENYLIGLGENNFADAMANRMQTLDGALSNLNGQWNKVFLNISKLGVGNAIKDGVDLATEGLEYLNAVLSSGLIEGGLKLVMSKFNTFGTDIASLLNNIGELWNEFLGSSEGEGIAGAFGDTVDFLIDAFKNFPENIKAFIELATVEVLNFVNKAGAYADEIASHLNPKNWFKEGDQNDLESALAQIESVYISSVENIISKRENLINQSDLQIEALQLEFKQVVSNVGATNDLANAEDNLAQFKVVTTEETGKSIAQLKEEERARRSAVKEAMRQADAYQEVINKLNTELATSNLSAQARDTFNALQQAGVDIMSVQGQEIERLIAKIYEQKEATDELAKSGQLMGDAFSNAFGMIGDELGGFGSLFSDFGSIFGKDLNNLINGDGLRGLFAGDFSGLGDLAGSAGQAAGGLLAGVGGGRYGGIGSAVGAAIGTALLPGVGTFIGGALGGLGGGFIGPDESDKTQSILINAATGKVTQGGFTDEKFSQENRSKADAAGQVITTLIDAIEEQTGKALEGVYDLAVGSRDGIDLLVNGVQVLEDYKGDVTDAVDIIFKDVLDQANIISTTYDNLALEGENFADAYIRVETQFDAVTYAAEQLGLEFTLVGDAGLVAADALTRATGGLGAFVEGADYFYNTFFTEQERFNDVLTTINSTFNDLGEAVPETREAFKDLVLSLDLNKQAGRETYAELMRLAPAMDLLFNKTDDWKEQVTGLYNDVFNRAPDAEGLAYWVEQLKTGSITFEELADVFKNSVEASVVSWLEEANNVKLSSDSFAESLGITDTRASNAAGSIDTLTGALSDLDITAGNNLALDLSREATLSGLTGTDRELYLLEEWRDAMVTSIQEFAVKGVDVADGLENVAIIYGNRLQAINDTIAESGEDLEDSLAKAFDPTNLQIRLLKAQGKDDQALALSRQVELDAADEAAVPLLRAIYKAEDLNSLIERREDILTRLEVQQTENAEEQLEVARELEGVLNNLTFGNLSPLTSKQRFEAAEEQYQKVSSKAATGDLDAIKQLNDVATQYLTEAQDRFASSGTYVDIYDSVVNKIESIIDKPFEAEQQQIDQDTLNQLKTISDQITEINNRSEEEFDRRQAQLIETIQTQTKNIVQQLLRVDATLTTNDSSVVR